MIDTAKGVNMLVSTDTKDLKGVTGAVSFDDLHNAVKSAVVIELVDGVDAKATLINP